MRNYFLKTERLGFAEWDEELFSQALELWGNTSVAKYITTKDVFSSEEIRERLKLEISNKQHYNVQYYPLFLLDGDVFIGACGLRPYDMTKSIYEFGFYLKPEYWGRGYAGEAAKAILKYTLDNLHVKNIYVSHHPDNTASKKSLEKLGFEYFIDEYYAPTGLYHPLYRLFNDN